MRTISRLENQKIGKLTVIRFISKQGWECQCDCGNVTIAQTNRLKGNKRISCGCVGFAKDLSKEQFERWVVKKRITHTNRSGIIWECECKICKKDRDISSGDLERKGGPICNCQRPMTESFLGKTFGDLTVLEEARKPIKNKNREWLGPHCLCQCKCGNKKWISKSDLFLKQKQSCGCWKHRKGAEKARFKYRRYDSSGYVRLYEPDHPNADKSGRVREHILIMSNYLGMPLTDDETVHHKNGKRDDNRIENLELWASNHPPGQRVEDLVLHAEFIIQKYKDYKNPAEIK